MDAKEIQDQIDADGGELIAVADLVPWDRNPRLNDIAAKELAAFVADKGWGAPVLVQRGTNRIIGGHTRWKAAKKLGLKRIPARVRTCDDRTADALAMADNKIGEVAEWNAPGVAEVLSQFGLEEAESMGWDSHDLEQLAKDVADFGPLEPATIVEDEVPEPPKVALTKPGDVWRMGRHTLVCGDATDPGAWDAIGRIDAVFTSPPYGVGEQNRIRADWKEGRKGTFYATHDDDPAKWPALMDAVTSMAASRATVSFVNVQMLGRNKASLINWMHDRRDQIIDVMIWDKGHGAPHIQPGIVASAFEFVFVVGDGSKKVIPFCDQRGAQNVVRVSSRGKREASEVHKASFPSELPAHFMNLCAGASTWADPFMGTGTTAIAAEQLGKSAHGIEIDPAYCDVIVERWQNLTGGKAERVSG